MCHTFVQHFPFPSSLLSNRWKTAMASSSIQCNISVSATTTTTAWPPGTHTGLCLYTSSFTQRNVCIIESMHVHFLKGNNSRRAESGKINLIPFLNEQTGCNRSGFDSVTGTLGFCDFEDQTPALKKKKKT